MNRPSSDRIVLWVAVTTALVATVACGVLAARLVAQEGWVTIASEFAQIVPGGLLTKDTTPDIPPATDLTPLKTFWKARQRVMNSYVYPDEIDEVNLTYGAIKGMRAALGDPYTRFMTPEDYADFQTESEGHFEGIGALLDERTDEETKDREVFILRVLPEGPASETDLRAGDVILAVDNKPVKGLQIHDVVGLIRGKGGTTVVLKVRREGEDDLLDIEIVRARVDFPIIEVKDPPVDDDGIGYLWLRSFNRQAEKDVREALDLLKREGMKGLLFDLSSDPGGMLDMAVAVTSLFLDNTPITWIGDRSGDPEAIPARSGIVLDEDVPIVVLIDGASASASEIVAGALQDTGRATIVGHHSFGKAKVQTVMELDDGSALVLTTAVYLTPKKRDISKQESRGIQPDVKFPDPPKGMQDWEQWHQQQIDRACDVLREKMAARGAG